LILSHKIVFFSVYKYRYVFDMLLASGGGID